MKEKILEVLHGNGEKVAGWLMILIIVGLIGYGFWWDTKYEYRCVGESKVEKILALKHRDAIILLENGMKVEVNQEWLEVGDPYCYASKKFEIED
jgi:high-affinity Fe2+/Pb2+ permease